MFVVYGTDNSKRLIEAKDIECAYEYFINNINDYMLNNHTYKIERYY